MNWYVVQTKPRKEDMVTSHFKNARLEVLNPKVKTALTGIRPLFPNYIFLRWDLHLAENYHMIRYTRGVSKVLGTNNMPVPLSEDVMRVILNRLSPDQVLEQDKLKVGTKIRVKRGILSDLVGVLERPVSAEGRVAVLLRIHEIQMKAELDCRDITLVA